MTVSRLALLSVLIAPIYGQTQNFFQRCPSSNEYTTVTCSGRSGQAAVTFSQATPFTVRNCAFVGCGPLTIKSSVTFENIAFLNYTNTAVVVDTTSATFDNTTFFNITARTVGGGINAKNSNVSILNSRFTNTNSTEGMKGGGAVYGINSNVTINNTVFDRNSASHRGGSLYIDTAAAFQLNNCNFTQGRANTSRGADFYNYQGSVTWTGGFSEGIYGDVRTNDQGPSGGSIGSEDGNFIVTNVNFRGQRVSWYGGAIYGIGRSVITVDNADFTDIQSMQQGGAVFTLSPAVFNCKNCHFRNSTALEVGGGIMASGSVNLENVVADNCSATNVGGFIFSSQASSLRMIDTKVLNSKLLNLTSPETYGAGVMIFGTTEVYLENVTISGSNNAATGGGMAAFGFEDPANVVNLVLNNTIIEFNNATFSGGIHVHNAKLTLNNVIIRNNTADGDAKKSSPGGLALQIWNRELFPTTFMGKVEIYNNNATGSEGKGGGMWMDTQATLIFKTADVSIYDNYAHMGDGIYSSVFFWGNSYGEIKTDQIPKEDLDAGKRIRIQNAFYFERQPLASQIAMLKPFEGHMVTLDSPLVSVRLHPMESTNIVNDYVLPTIHATALNAFGTTPVKLPSKFPCIVKLVLETSKGDNLMTAYKYGNIEALNGTTGANFSVTFSNISLANTAFASNFDGIVRALFYTVPQDDTQEEGDRVQITTTQATVQDFTLSSEVCKTDDCIRVATSYANGKYYYSLLPKLRVSDMTRLSFFIISIAVILVALAFGLYAHIHREVKIYKVTSPFFTNLITFGCILQLLSISVRGFFKPASPSIYSCMAIEWLELIGFVIVGFSIILKTSRIQAIFINTLKTRGRADSITNELLGYWLLMFIIIAVAFLATWTAKGKLTVLDLNFQNQKISDEQQRYLTSLVQVGGASGWVQSDKCVSVDGATFFPLLSVIIHLVIVVVSAYYAFSCRSVPAQYNETKTMLLMAYSWLFSSGILFPLGEYLLVLPNQAFFIQVFRVLAPVCLTLFLLHVPRAYIVVFHPSQAGSKGSTFGTGGSNNKKSNNKSTNHSSNKGSTDKLSQK